MFTAGARLQPTSRLMLRASLATGERPPTLADLQGATVFRLPGALAVQDPRRPGRPLGSEGSWKILTGGSTRVGSAEATSFSAGAVFNPEGRGGPRLPWTIRGRRWRASRRGSRWSRPTCWRRKPIIPSGSSGPRSPMQRRRRGFGGRVTALDMTLINAGRTEVEAVDLQVDWRLPARGADDVRLYGALTWEPTFATRRRPARRRSTRSATRTGRWNGAGTPAWSGGADR